jgi:hypothetical protein
MNTKDALKDAQNAFRARKASESLKALEYVLREGKPTDNAAGYLLRGLIYEFGGDGVSIDLTRAIESYRAASHSIQNSDAIPFLYLARALIKQGPESYSSALKYIQQASIARHTPEVDLAYASYYELTNNLGTAKKHYLKAAINGRFAGFFGLSSVLRKNGKSLQAFIVDCCRILLGPLLFILLGKKARASFNGY